jgi:hypothetical protein
MNKKNLFIASLTANVALIVIIFLVKKDATNQAQEYVKETLEKSKYQMAQVNDNVQNNNLLWVLIDSTWRSPDKSKAFVKKLADSQKVPRCNGKDCTGTEDEARLRTSISSNAQDRSIKVGWGSGKNKIKYSFKVIYDQKDKFVTIDASDLLGKASSGEAGTGEEEPAEEAAE